MYDVQTREKEHVSRKLSQTEIDRAMIRLTDIARKMDEETTTLGKAKKGLELARFLTLLSLEDSRARAEDIVYLVYEAYKNRTLLKEEGRLPSEGHSIDSTAVLKWRGEVYADALHYVKEAHHITGMHESKTKNLNINVDIKLLESKLEGEITTIALRLPAKESQNLLEAIKR
jgi:hypothetical protein